MLGEQLIKNDRIALVELIKNSYDADASRAIIDFQGFGNPFKKTDHSMIAVVDDGLGMTEDVIRNHWLNPATAAKLGAKQENPVTAKGRVMQGEKGIGRFAMFKIANAAKITTRAIDSQDEYVLEFDLSFLDEKSASGTAKAAGAGAEGPPEFVDQIKVHLTRREPTVFNGVDTRGLLSTHGMRIELSGLRSNWTPSVVMRTYDEVARLRPLVPPSHLELIAPENQFEVAFQADGDALPFEVEVELKLERLLDDRAVLRVEGIFDSDTKSFLFDVNGEEYPVDLESAEVRGLRTYKKYFEDPRRPRDVRDIECGTFHFGFYVFDLLSTAPDEYRLDKDQKNLVKEHRIYLYRDGVRVQPYGDAQDDWLQLDVIRGTQGADQVLSNDQTVGFVYITQKENPELKDKTNREGLLESGHAFADFVAVLQIAVAHVRRTHFAPYLEEQRRKRQPQVTPTSDVGALLGRLSRVDALPTGAAGLVARVEKAYVTEKDLMATQLHRLEDLAGVGLSVEAASHDIVASGTKALRLARGILQEVEELSPRNRVLERDVFSLIEFLAFVSSRLQDIQGLFVSTRQAKRQVNVSDYVARVQRIYGSLLGDRHVKVGITEKYAELMVMSTDAALLQLLINLFDNSLYWLEASREANPEIQIVLDSSKRQLIFADNGPGVSARDEPYIFEPFYSGKDADGKGLGLYIARQVGARSGFSVSLVTDSSEQVLPGANFVIVFDNGTGD